MRPTLALVLLGLLAPACTEPVERVTEVLTPSPGASATPIGERVTEVVGDAIAVETPFEGSEVGAPVSVTGTADVAGAQVTVRVLDGSRAELAQTIVEASCGDGCAGTFAAELYYFVPSKQPGWIEVSGASAEGPPPRVLVPVILFP
jgi:hypothetical protein